MTPPTLPSGADETARPGLLALLQRINLISHRARTLEEMLEAVLEVVLEAFACDRAWLSYPCDPDSPTWRIPMEKTRPEWPGAYARGGEFDMTPSVRLFVNEALAADGPLAIQVTDSSGYVDDPHTKRFSIRSVLTMALYPKTGKPWMLGIHHCRARHDFSPHEIETFRELALRLTESLDSMLAIRALRDNEALFRGLFETSRQGIISQDPQGRVLYINPAAQRLLGLTAADLARHPEALLELPLVDEAGRPVPLTQRPEHLALQHGQRSVDRVLGLAVDDGDGPRWLLLSALPQCRPHEAQPCQVISTYTDITPLKRAENTARAHIRHLNFMERISAIILSATSLDTVLQEVLDAMLDIFRCDRAWLLYPCDPASPTWRVPMERTRPQWPGAHALNQDIAMTPEVASALESCLASPRPVPFDEQNAPPSPPETAARFGIKSQIAFALHPKVGKPWLLGIHYCGRPHRASPGELQIMEDIGHRLADALTGLLTLKDLRASEARFRTLVEHAPEAIVVLDADSGCLTDANDNACRLFGIKRDALKGVCWDSLAAPEHGHARAAAREHIAAAVAGATPVFEWRLRHRHGETRHCEVRMVRLPAERPLVRCSITDITARKRAEAQMRKLSRALEQAADAVMITDRDGIIEYVNPAFTRISGYAMSEALGKTPRLVKSGRHGDDHYRALWQNILKGEVYSGIMINRRKDGQLYYEEKTITPLKNEEGRITHFVSTGRDISERIRAEQRLHHLAHHDSLTQVPNRALFMDRLNQSLHHAQRHGRRLAVMFLDLDRFKLINDTLGHDVGDQVLVTMAGRLRACLRAEDTVARLGGDEFVLLLEEISSVNKLTAVSQKILEALSEPVQVQRHELFVTASIGIALYPSDGTTAEALLKHADIAMYQAKDQGRNTCRYYSADMNADAVQRLTLETALRRAIEKHELSLVFQPQWALDTGRLVGVEALLRWRHPDLGVVAPATFIPVLEETGLIAPAGQWALHTACCQLAAWRAAHPVALRMSVNLSSRQFDHPAFPEALLALESDTGVPAQWLELEITESLLLRQHHNTFRVLEQLTAAGYRLAVDDFGTGYSSLSYLKRFPIDTLKIDRSFIRDLATAPDDAAITQAIIAMARSLNLNVVAEGVETTEQLAFLRQAGCALGQGFLVSPPLEAAALEALLGRPGSSLLPPERV
ncbi:MAG TPA: EAL domain-containing protein [Gammaproteobacteria bacterium]|nr:EAL domain-containing protein [Gammaproteobacteria bacterium]